MVCSFVIYTPYYKPSKLKNARKKLGEEIVSKIVKYNDIIITEKLKVKEMIEKKKNSNNKNLRKSIINATFSEIIRRLEYKCRWLNKVFYQVGTYYASSQICSGCGNINKELKDLRIREYKCPKCWIEVLMSILKCSKKGIYLCTKRGMNLYTKLAAI